MKIEHQKIVVVGVSASGKSTFSRSLAQKTHLPLFHMDEIMWRPGWKYIGDQKTIEALREITGKNQWIIDGYITTQARSFVFEKADVIFHLDYNPYLLCWRYIKRCIKHRKKPRPELPNNPDKFSWEFFMRILLKEEAVGLVENLDKVRPQNKIMRFTSSRTAESYMKNI